MAGAIRPLRLVCRLLEAQPGLCALFRLCDLDPLTPILRPA
jgi:hypothetical protein